MHARTKTCWGIGLVLGLCFSRMLSATPLTLQDGDLTVQLLTQNGAINSVVFQGSEFFRHGVASSISHYGLQVNNDLNSVLVNDSAGTVGFPTTYLGGSSFLSNYLYQTSQIETMRIYSLLPGLNTLRIVTNAKNNGPAVVLSLFETYDPDQGVDRGLGNATRNDVNAIDVALWGAARIDGPNANQKLTVLAGSYDLRTTVASGGPFSLFDGADVVDFFDYPYDANDFLEDQGLHIGLRVPLAAGESTSWTYDLVFGGNLTETEENFFAANSIVPEPRLGLMLLLIAGLVGYAQLKK